MKFNVISDIKNRMLTNISYVGRLAARLWQKIHALLFFLFLIVAVLAGGYVWQRNLYNGRWSFEREQEYLNSQNDEVVFRQDDFQKVLDGIRTRKDRLSKEYQPIKDIFEPYK